MAFDAIVQRDAHDGDYGAFFARFETRFQIAWVLGALVPVILRIPPRLGFFVIALAAALAGASFLFGQRTLPDHGDRPRGGRRAVKLDVPEWVGSAGAGSRRGPGRRNRTAKNAAVEQAAAEPPATVPPATVPPAPVPPVGSPGQEETFAPIPGRDAPPIKQQTPLPRSPIQPAPSRPQPAQPAEPAGPTSQPMWDDHR